MSLIAVMQHLSIVCMLCMAEYRFTPGSSGNQVFDDFPYHFVRILQVRS